MPNNTYAPGETRKWVLTLGGFLAFGRTVWWLLEWLDVIGGSTQFLGQIGPFLKAHWADLLPLVGVGLIIYEIGRAKGLWTRLIGHREQTLPAPPPAAPVQPVQEQEPEPPPSAPPPPEPMASQDSAERLLEMYKPWELALASAIEVLEKEICRYAGDLTKEIELLSFAIREYPIRNVQLKLSGLREEFKNFTPRQVPQQQFDDLKEDARDILPHLNFQLVFWINKAGPVIRGDELYSSRTYLRFLDFYGKALEAAGRHKYHSEVGELARTLMNVETKPDVTPSEGPASSKASGPDPQP